MANYANLKATINANIKANGAEEITGPILNNVLNAAVNALGAGWQYMGVATPATSPGTPDANVFYIASTAGTYTNFGGLAVAEGEVAILKYNGSWAKEVTGAATAAQVTQLGQEVYGIDTLTLPEGLKTLNWEQANHSRKVWYEDGALNFKVVGVSSCNIVQANSSANQQEDCWKEVNTEFWNSDAPLILKVRYNLAQPTRILIGYKKGSISSSYNSSYYLINATGEGEIEIDVKELLKRDNATSYQLISFVTPYSIAAQGESYGTNEVRVYGFEEEVEGDIQRIDGEVSELRNSVGSKQNILVSGKNIKTLNGESILGAGDIVIKSDDMVSLASVLQLRANLPSYYTEQPSDPTSYDDDSYIDVKVDSVPDGKKFIFFTDSHWDYYVGNPKTSPALIAYVRNRLNIRNVIFGGDFIDVKDTKYLAKQVLGDFAYKCLAAFGSGFLPVMGNHDNNLAGQDISDPDVVASHYLPNDVVYDVMFKNAVKPNGNYWDDNKTTLLSMAQTAGFSEDDIADLEGECRMDYWYDDPVNGIRYIVHNTETPHVTPMWRLFDTATTPYMVWLYNVLCSTPAGYDVCLAVHMLGTPNTTPQEDDLALRQLTSLLMGLKTRTAKEFYISRRNDNCTTMWPWTRHTLDFTQCNPVGKVFVIVGHDHGDAISIANQSTTTFNIVQVSTYDGVSTIDQTTIQPNNGCSIPIIWTATNSLRGASGGGSGIKGDRPPGENGTVTEQIFDVFSIQDDGIRITRVGAGSDRTLLING